MPSDVLFPPVAPVAQMIARQPARSPDLGIANPVLDIFVTPPAPIEWASNLAVAEYFDGSGAVRVAIPSARELKAYRQSVALRDEKSD